MQPHQGLWVEVPSWAALGLLTHREKSEKGVIFSRLFSVGTMCYIIIVSGKEKESWKANLTATWAVNYAGLQLK